MNFTGQNEEKLGSDVQKLGCSSCESLCDRMELYRCACLPDSDSCLCDLCISPHIRKQHKIVDCKGYEPAICSTHNALCTFFCERCEVIICFKCLGSHCEHKFISAADKALDLRKIVFEYLNKFDNLSKTLAERKAAVDKAYTFRADSYPSLADENFLDGLCSNFERIVRSNSAEWNSLLSESVSEDIIQKICERADSKISNLRWMLSLSDGVFISEFLRSKSSLDSSIAEQKSILDAHSVVKWCRDLNSILEDCIRVTLETWKLPVYERKQFLNIDLEPCEKLSLRHKVEWRTIIYDIIVLESRTSFVVLESNKPPERHQIEISDVCSVYRDSDLIALLNVDNLVRIYNLNENRFVSVTQLSEDLELLGFSFSEPHYFFYCWSRKNACIQPVTGEHGDWTFFCESKPKLFKLKKSIIMSVGENNIVTFYNFLNKIRVEVLPQHHGLTQIDNVVFTSTLSTMLFFDYGMKTILVCKINLNHKLLINWEIKEIYRVSNSQSFDCMAWDTQKVLACKADKMFIGDLRI